MATKLTMTAKNKAFWNLPKEKQRILVAKDVLKQIQMRSLKVKQGTYFGIWAPKKRFEIEKPKEKLDQFLLQIKNENAKCEVCGIGSCFISLVRLGNNAKTSTFFGEGAINGFYEANDGDMRPLLRKVFPSSQITLIESAFEMTTILYDNAKHSYEHRIKARDFGQKYKSDENRLKAIMRNIIKNKGTFKP